MFRKSLFQLLTISPVLRRESLIKRPEFLPVTELSASRLSLLLHEVLTDSIYRDNAQRFQKIIAGHNGSAAAGDLLEEAFGLISRTGRSIKPTAELAESLQIQ